MIGIMDIRAKQQRGRKEKYLSIIDYTDSFIYYHVGLSKNDQEMCSYMV